MIRHGERGEGDLSTAGEKCSIYFFERSLASCCF